MLPIVFYYFYTCTYVSTFAGETAKFNMTFILLRNTPLDVYFLSDVSGSLQFSIEALTAGIIEIGMLPYFLECVYGNKTHNLRLENLTSGTFHSVALCSE